MCSGPHGGIQTQLIATSLTRPSSAELVWSMITSVNGQAADTLVEQSRKAQLDVSGVNLDEEYGNLQRYQQYYLANAQVLQTANALFDALINIR